MLCQPQWTRVGTRKAILKSFPVRSGMTMPTALVSAGAGTFQAALCFTGGLWGTYVGRDGSNETTIAALGAY